MGELINVTNIENNAQNKLSCTVYILREILGDIVKKSFK